MVATGGRRRRSAEDDNDPKPGRMKIMIFN
jgi:hypothetical protein